VFFAHSCGLLASEASVANRESTRNSVLVAQNGKGPAVQEDRSVLASTSRIRSSEGQSSSQRPAQNSREVSTSTEAVRPQAPEQTSNARRSSSRSSAQPEVPRQKKVEKQSAFREEAPEEEEEAQEQEEEEDELMDQEEQSLRLRTPKKLGKRPRIESDGEEEHDEWQPSRSTGKRQRPSAEAETTKKPRTPSAKKAHEVPAEGRGSPVLSAKKDPVSTLKKQSVSNGVSAPSKGMCSMLYVVPISADVR
jgi:hypothetical protein